MSEPGDGALDALTDDAVADLAPDETSTSEVVGGGDWGQGPQSGPKGGNNPTTGGPSNDPGQHT